MFCRACGSQAEMAASKVSEEILSKISLTAFGLCFLMQGLAFANPYIGCLLVVLYLLSCWAPAAGHLVCPAKFL